MKTSWKFGTGFALCPMGGLAVECNLSCYVEKDIIPATEVLWCWET
jgi:hypothetical protein